MDTPTIDCPLGLAGTNKTGETDAVSNDDFLCTAFGDVVDNTRPMAVSFTANSVTMPQSAWFGCLWLYYDTIPRCDATNYFSLAMFRPDEASRKAAR
ncbi:MAG: hypothetical protein U1F68_18750 [Gammaproteobacteria bacterium]